MDAPKFLQGNDQDYLLQTGGGNGSLMQSLMQGALFGQPGLTSPGNFQSVSDHATSVYRVRRALDIQSNAWQQSQLYRTLGLQYSSMAAGAARFLGGPGSAMARTFSSINGGDPAGAQLSFYSNMTGNSLAAFGRGFGSSVDYGSVGNLAMGIDRGMRANLQGPARDQYLAKQRADFVGHATGGQVQFGGSNMNASELNSKTQKFIDALEGFSKDMPNLRQAIRSREVLAQANNQRSYATSKDASGNVTVDYALMRRQYADNLAEHDLNDAAYTNHLDDEKQGRGQERLAVIQRLNEFRKKDGKSALRYSDKIDLQREEILALEGAGDDATERKLREEALGAVYKPYDTRPADKQVMNKYVNMLKKLDPSLSAANLRDMTNEEQLDLISSKMKDGKLDVTSDDLGPINSAVTRGFHREDFAQAISGQAHHRLIGEGQSLNGDFTQDQVKKLAPLMDAMRPLYGRDATGGDIMKGINDLMGGSSINLMDDGQLKAFQDKVTRMKVIAEQAGTGVQTLQAMMESVHTAASNSPYLQGMNKISQMDLSADALKNASVRSGMLSSSEVRRRGGTTGMASSELNHTMNEMQTPQMRQFFQLAGHLNEEQSAQLQQEVESAGGMGQFLGRDGLTKIMQTGQRYGVDHTVLASNMNSAAVVADGQKSTLGQYGLSAKSGAGHAALDAFMADPNYQGKINEWIQKGDKLSIGDIQAYFPDQDASMWHAIKDRVDEKRDPAKFKQAKEQSEALIVAQTNLETKFNAVNAALNDPKGEIVQSLLSGNVQRAMDMVGASLEGSVGIKFDKSSAGYAAMLETEQQLQASKGREIDDNNLLKIVSKGGPDQAAANAKRKEIAEVSDGITLRRLNREMGRDSSNEFKSLKNARDVMASTPALQKKFESLYGSAAYSSFSSGVDGAKGTSALLVGRAKRQMEEETYAQTLLQGEKGHRLQDDYNNLVSSQLGGFSSLQDHLKIGDGATKDQVTKASQFREEVYDTLKNMGSVDAATSGSAQWQQAQAKKLQDMGVDAEEADRLVKDTGGARSAAMRGLDAAGKNAALIGDPQAKSKDETFEGLLKGILGQLSGGGTGSLGDVVKGLTTAIQELK